MKFTLFSKELLGGKKKLMMFCVCCILTYILVAIQVVLSVKTFASEIIPDLVFSGEVSSGFISFEKYGDVKSGFTDVVSNKLGGKVEAYELIERNIITVQKENSLENVTYSIFACSNDFFNNKLSTLIREGKIPEEGKKQAIVGGYLAKAFHIEVGDVIAKKSVELANLGTVDIVLDLSGEFEEIEYEVVGILDSADGYFDYSFLIGRETQPEYVCNTVWTYFTEDVAADLYVENIVGADKAFFSDYGIGYVSESYRQKDSGLFSLVLKNGYLFLLVIVFSYIMIAYVFKGVTYKLGIMKALGISNRYIYKCYFAGVFVIQVFSYFLSIVAMNYLCVGVNNTISKAYGYDVNIYRVTLNMILFVTLMFVLTLSTFWLSLQFKINHINPKVAMNMKL